MLLKVILLLFFASQIAAKKLKISKSDSLLVIHDAILTGDTDLAEVNFSNFEAVEFDDPQVRTLTLKMQSPMANVKKLAISMGNVETVHLAPNFEEILFSSGKVQSVIINPVSSYKTVEFAVKNGQLRRFPENLSALKKVKVLNFYNNDIETVDMADLNGLNDLEEINLIHNQITSVNFFQAVIPKLETIDLSLNRLEEIRMNDFTAPLLYKSDLSENQIETVNMTQFSRFANLDSIRLNNNQIKKITSNSVALPKLRLFTIGYNRLNEISFESWNAPLLEAIIIEENQLKKAPGLATVFPALEKVWLFPNSFNEEWLNGTLKQLNLFDLPSPTATSYLIYCGLANLFLDLQRLPSIFCS